jgi:hypothetical protein
MPPTPSGSPGSGGAGTAENRLIALKADTDVFTTFEGDNHVLIQLWPEISPPTPTTSRA